MKGIERSRGRRGREKTKGTSRGGITGRDLTQVRIKANRITDAVGLTIDDLATLRRALVS